jgi:hypothetical protein
MGYGLWAMVYGLWAMGYGLRAMGYELWVMGYGLIIQKTKIFIIYHLSSFYVSPVLSFIANDLTLAINLIFIRA